LRFTFPVAAVSLAVLLASCGGGGSDTPVATTTTPAATTGSPSTGSPSAGSASTGGSVPANTYAAGSPQAAAFQQLNSARSQCGFPTLAQAAELDKSATAHANYMASNSSYAHEEVQGRTGFTGVQFSDRETAAGYRWIFAGEVLAQVPRTGTGADAVRLLMAAPYHEALLLNDFHDVGFGWTTVSGFPTLTGDLGTRSGQSVPGPSTVLTFPCNGINDAVAVSGAESPSPFPSNASATWGQPITVRGPSDLAIKSATITGPSGSVQVLAIYGSGQAADPNNTGDFTNGTSIIIPAALQAGTTYNVNIAYTAGGAAGTKTFSFATAP
jgi:uncharacterized protein YkwD